MLQYALAAAEEVVVVRVLCPLRRYVYESWCHLTTQRWVVEQASVATQLVGAQERVGALVSIALGERPASKDLLLGHRAVEACPL